MRRNILTIILLSALIVVLLLLCLLCGSVSIPAGEIWAVLSGQSADATSQLIILESRMPQAVVALLSGAALAVSGLLLQTIFSNPLADPSILGINSGAGLGVGIVVLVAGGTGAAASWGLTGFVLMVAAALIGAGVVILLLLLCSSLVRSNMMLLIIGIMISYALSSIISLLNYLATADSLQAFMLWGMGSFGSLSRRWLLPYAVVITAGLIGSLLLVKPLNALLLGDRYARNLGVNIRRIRTLLLLLTGILSAAVTAACGPIAFIGLAVPHITRMMTGTSDHRVQLPATLLCGSAVALLCCLLCNLPMGGGVLPLNVVTPLFGVPVILYVLLCRRNTYNTI